MDNLTITTLKSILHAAEEANTKGIHSRQQLVTWALQYGKRLGVKQNQIEDILDQPLSQILGLETKGTHDQRNTTTDR